MLLIFKFRKNTQGFKDKKQIGSAATKETNSSNDSRHNKVSNTPLFFLLGCFATPNDTKLQPELDLELDKN